MLKDLNPSDARRLISPTMVALISTEDGEKTNVMTVANCIVLSKSPVLIGIPIVPERYTHQLIEQNKEFVINIPHQRMEHVVKYCGKNSGKNVDKIKELNLSVKESLTVKSKYIEWCLGHIECKVVGAIKPGTHTLFIGEVTFAQVSQEHFQETWNFIDESPLLFDFTQYHSIEKVGKMYMDMKWPEIDEKVANEDVIAILPIGSVEQHGYGLPVKTDSFIVSEIARLATRQTGDLLLPTVYYGYNEKELDFAELFR